MAGRETLGRLLVAAIVTLTLVGSACDSVATRDPGVDAGPSDGAGAAGAGGSDAHPDAAGGAGADGADGPQPCGGYQQACCATQPRCTSATSCTGVGNNPGVCLPI
jgi:hypothetical protein